MYFVRTVLAAIVYPVWLLTSSHWLTYRTRRERRSNRSKLSNLTSLKMRRARPTFTVCTLSIGVASLRNKPFTSVEVNTTLSPTRPGPLRHFADPDRTDTYTTWNVGVYYAARRKSRNRDRREYRDFGVCGDSWQSPSRRIMYKISSVELLSRQLGSQINSGIQC